METIARFKKGKVTLFQQKGEYQGKPTTSWTLQKSIFKKESNTWEKSDFYTITDLQDIQSILQRVIAEYVKFEKVMPKPKPEPSESPSEFGEVYNEGELSY